MVAKLNHTIVVARDKEKSALFLSEIMGLEPPLLLSHFALVTVGDQLTLDYVTTDREITPQHYAFLVNEDEFDEIFGRVRAHGLDYWAGPSHSKSGEINRWDDGRGVYFDDPNGHSLEIITRPYGSEGTSAERPHPLVAEVIQKSDEKERPTSIGQSEISKEN